LILDCGEATPWHVDPFHHVTVIVRGDSLALEHLEGGRTQWFNVARSIADWDRPADKAHRADNVATKTYSEE